MPRIVMDLGDKKQEARCRGGAYVAQSRPETEADFAYAATVTLERLTAIGKGKAAELLREELDALAVRADRTAVKYAALMEDVNFEALLHWAEVCAAANGIVPPYLLPVEVAAPAEATDNSMDVEPNVSSRLPKRPIAASAATCKRFASALSGCSSSGVPLHEKPVSHAADSDSD